jgi:hypothetical protein
MLALFLSMVLGATVQNVTVFKSDGGRVRGTILEAGTGAVTIQLADGTTRWLDAATVARIELADGTVWKPDAAPVAAAPVAAVPVAAAPVAVPVAAVPVAAVPAAAAAPVAPPVPAVPLPVPAPAQAATTGRVSQAMVVPVDKLDSLRLANGGRVRGLVTEAGPEGVAIRLVDGAERRFAPDEVTRIDYADGTTSTLGGGGAGTAVAAPAR